MPRPRFEKPHWPSLLLGLSFLLNVALVSLVALRHDRRTISGARHAVGDRPDDAADRLRRARGSARVVTEGLPAGYRMILRGHAGSISALCFAPGYSRLGLTTNSGYITVWNLASREVEWETEIPGRNQGYGLIDTLAFSPDGDQLAYAVRVESPVPDLFTLHIRDLRTSREKAVRDDQTAMDLGGCTSLAFSPDGRTIAAGGIKGVALFNAAEGNVRGTLGIKKRVFYGDLSYSANGNSLLAVTGAIPVMLDARSGRNIADLSAKSTRHLRPCRAVLSPDAARIAASSSDNRVTLWNAVTGQEIISIKEGMGSGFTEGSCWVEFTSDGRSFLTASRNDDVSRLFVRRRRTIDGSLVNQAEIVQPGGTSPYLYPRLFTADGTKLALIGVKDETRFIPEPDMGITTVQEGVVAIYDTSQLLDGGTRGSSPFN